jgi:hypothetical protein
MQVLFLFFLELILRLICLGVDDYKFPPYLRQKKLERYPLQSVCIDHSDTLRRKSDVLFMVGACSSFLPHIPIYPRHYSLL